ncbi:hypothetical protein OLEAN_C24950 [Oleispira antarctica RB-8]|uniref:Uncharacterized protein n=1 Tax=Oleispira antarctica RB-8 TaxID=698738 RepID=R4YNL7_OLEAN|nr:hypothetical protein OLEAN_C24950 [Oleispira antarctica RB-8]
MSIFLEKLKNLKGKSKAQFDQFILENAKKSVLKELQDNDVSPDDITPEEMDELLAEEIKTQREFAKGLATGSIGFAVLLELLG